MKVLIFGASNSIAIYLARYLHCNDHIAVLADTSRYARGFYSRYCRGKYIIRNPDDDLKGFFSDIKDCIRKEDIGLIVPASDQAMLDIARAKEVLPENVKTLFPPDYQKIVYVMDKRNVPVICEKAGITTANTVIVNGDMAVPDIEQLDRTMLHAPYALKLSGGHSGEGFMKVETFEKVIAGLKHMKLAWPDKSYLIQEYIEGEVYGAGAVFEDSRLKHFYSYRHIRRYPALCGVTTVCQADNNDTIREAMIKVLTALGWSGFCHMDFILDEKRNKTPYLIDINPVHWYSVPNSIAKEYSSLSCYLDGGRRNQLETSRSNGQYTTIWLCRELQRIVSGLTSRKDNSPAKSNYWSCFRGLKSSDFYWDPLPIVLAPLLKLFKTHTRW